MTRDDIKATLTFQGFEGYKKLIYSKAANMRHLERSYNIALRVGYEQWKQEYKPCDSDDKIVSELLKSL
jgi:hypothetical protein